MAKLKAATRNSLPDSDFAVIVHSNGKKIRKFPIEDISHARNALARAANASPKIRAAVDAKVARKYPSLSKRGK